MKVWLDRGLIGASDRRMRSDAAGILVLEGLPEGQFRLETAGAEPVMATVAPDARATATLIVP